MSLECCPYSLPLWAATAGLLVLTYVIWRRRSAPGATWLTLFALAVAVWTGVYAFELVGADLATKVFWAKLEYAGIVLAPVLWLLFVLTYTGQTKRLGNNAVALLFVIPAVTLTLVWSNGAHHLIWRSTQLKSIGSLHVLATTYGPWFWIHTGYSYLLLFLASLLLLRGIVRLRYLYRGQLTALLIAAVLPWLGNLLYLTRAGPFPNLDLTPLGFGLGSVAVAWSLVRYRLLNLVPLARETVIEGMQDGVLVLDTHQRVVDFNPAARHVFEPSTAEVMGHPVADVLVRELHPVDHLLAGTPTQKEITLGAGETERFYDLHISPLSDSRNYPAGHVMTWHEITQLKQTERELRELAQTLEQRVEQRTAQLAHANQGLHRLTRRLMDLQETERREVAYELHEEIAQVLSGLQVALEMSTRGSPEDVGRTLNEAQTVIKDLISEVRELALELRPAMLDHLGLLPALLWQVEHFSGQTEIPVDFRHAGLAGARFPPDIETAAYRIVQEALSNAVRHAPRSEVAVRVWVDDEALNVQVEYSGREVDVDTLLGAGRGEGINVIRERATSVNGRLIVESTSEQTTTLIAQLPLYDQSQLEEQDTAP